MGTDTFKFQNSEFEMYCSFAQVGKQNRSPPAHIQQIFVQLTVHASAEASSSSSSSSVLKATVRHVSLGLEPLLLSHTELIDSVVLTPTPNDKERTDWRQCSDGELTGNTKGSTQQIQ